MRSHSSASGVHIVLCILLVSLLFVFSRTHLGQHMLGTFLVECKESNIQGKEHRPLDSRAGSL